MISILAVCFQRAIYYITLSIPLRIHFDKNSRGKIVQRVQTPPVRIRTVHLPEYFVTQHYVQVLNEEHADGKYQDHYDVSTSVQAYPSDRCPQQHH